MKGEFGVILELGAYLRGDLWDQFQSLIGRKVELFDHTLCELVGCHQCFVKVP